MLVNSGIIGSDYGLSPIQHQTTIRTYDSPFLVGSLGEKITEIPLILIPEHAFENVSCKMAAIFFSINVLIDTDVCQVDTDCTKVVIWTKIFRHRGHTKAYFFPGRAQKTSIKLRLLYSGADIFVSQLIFMINLLWGLLALRWLVNSL